MRTALDERLAEAKEIRRKIMQGDARLCIGYQFGHAWKGIFKHKAAEELSQRTGCSLRTAAYELSGEREPSALSLAALLVECSTKR